MFAFVKLLMQLIAKNEDQSIPLKKYRYQTTHHYDKIREEILKENEE